MSELAERRQSVGEYIEREALEKYIEKGLNNPDKAKAFGHDAIEILTELHHMPAADVVPVRHGRWIFEPETLSTRAGYRCSSCCGPLWFSPDVSQAFDYCPNCGAKMDEEEA